MPNKNYDRLTNKLEHLSIDILFKTKILFLKNEGLAKDQDYKNILEKINEWQIIFDERYTDFIQGRKSA